METLNISSRMSRLQNRILPLNIKHYHFIHNSRILGVYSHKRRNFSFTLTCKLNTVKGNKPSKEKSRISVPGSDTAAPPVVELEEGSVGNGGKKVEETKNSAVGSGLFKKLPRKVSGILSNLPLAIAEMFAVAVAVLMALRLENKKANSDGVFVVPNNNAFGNSFRDYSAETERKKMVKEVYRQSHINQTYDFVKKMREGYGKLNKVEMSIWECCELLNEVVDDSDPDLDEPQIQHLLQTAEAIRKDYPNEDWLHLTALIHDLGKVLLLPSFGGLPQWAVVGDTFPLGCAFDESIVHYEQLKDNPDYKNPAYNTKYGVYSEGCGLNNVVMSWGHDDYMYLVAKGNKTTLPSAALFIIRYHSFYPLHKSGAYTHLMNEEDRENLKWLQIFSKYDLYSKSDVGIDVEKVTPYYMSLIEKYFPAKLKW